MESYEYYTFRNTLTVEDIGPGMYYFHGSFNGFVLSGIFNRALNAFTNIDNIVSTMSFEEINKIKEIIKEEIQAKEKKI